MAMSLLFLCATLYCAAQEATASMLHASRIDSVTSLLKTGATRKSAVEELRERAMKLQEELSELPSDGLGVKEANMKAFEVPSGDSQLQTSVEAVSTQKSQSDKEIFSKLAATALDEPEDQVLHALKGVEAKAEDLGSIDDSHPLSRPNLASGKPEEVDFGLFAKSFYGANFKTASFVIDVIMTAKWTDKRVATLIPDGLDSLTLSKAESEKKIWLPGLVITNRDIRQYDLISTAVFIKKSGEVFKVERATAIIKNKFPLADFPFDRQQLVVKIASEKYMLDDVVLKPSKDGVGVAKDLLDGDGFEFVDVGASAIKDVDGALKKSRGLLTITIDRSLNKYRNSHLIPSFLVVMISWGIFWFPFVPPFITPRLAMSILSLLNFTILSVKSSSSLPAGAPFNWNDVINRTILTMMFTTVCLNIVAECFFHQLKIESLAKSVNLECKFFVPGVTIVSLALILSAAGRNGWMTLETTSGAVNLFILSVVGGYLALTASRTMSALAKKKVEELAKAEAPQGIAPFAKK